MASDSRDYLLPMERLEYIRAAVEKEGSVRVAELSRRLGVSEATVRHDLAQLEQMGLVKRTYGGATLRRGTLYERSFREQEAQYREEKARIAEEAVKLVRPGQLVLLDVGTTTTAIARRLPDLENLVVCTSALNIAVELERCRNVTVMVTGGTVRYKQHSLVNPLGTLLISQINADLLFLGCNGVSTEHGVTNSNLPEAEIKQAMVRAAKEVVVVADSSKIGNVAAAYVAPLSAVDMLITDAGADPEELERIRKSGVKVVVV
ncbi:MAG: DeoR/GlpR family DNA-binding transcription regulator [Limnochordales bacterium]